MKQGFTGDQTFELGQEHDLKKVVDKTVWASKVQIQLILYVQAGQATTTSVQSVTGFDWPS